MEKYILNSDMNLFCITAKSFPNGIKAAFEDLEKMLGSVQGRTFFGISYQAKEGDIIYKAAVLESFEGEAEKYGQEKFILKKGEYLTENIMNWRGKEQTIGTTFKKLLEDPRLDTNFPCVEWYKNHQEVMCMVRIDSSKN